MAVLEFPALANDFTDTWIDKVDDLTQDHSALRKLADAVESGDYNTAPILAGQTAGLLRAGRPAAEVIIELAEGAEAILRSRVPDLLRDH
jgi:nitronate monooxygenase